MARFGFIHSKLDTKLLILYILTRVAGPIDFATLTDLVMCDDGVDYFEFAEALSELLESGHLVREGDYYSPTDKGRRNCADGESSLSPVIRKRCDQRLAPFNAALKRKAQVRSRVDPSPDGTFYTVRLMLDDDRDNLFTLSLLTATREEGEDIAQRFTQHPDLIYNGVLGILLSDPEKRGETH